MPIVPAQAYENSIINALAVSDPQLNTALGTPVRKIITAVAQEMAGFNVDVNVTTTLYSIDSVSGTELDYLVGQFGFARQAAMSARGTITIHRDNGDSVMVIPYGTQFIKQSDSTSPSVMFQTTSYCEMREGVLSANASVVASVVGSIGNVPANSITYVSSSSSDYVTVSNERPTTGGRDAETDEQLRKRFLETVFRNVSGTRDQLVALALAHEQVSKANLIGQESRFSEIVQVEDGASGTSSAHVSDDAWELDVARAIDVDRRYWVTLADSGEVLSHGDYHVPKDGDSPGKSVVFRNRDDECVIGPIIHGAKRMLAHSHVANLSLRFNEDGSVFPSNYCTIDYDEGSVTFIDSGIPERYIGGTLTASYEYKFIGGEDFIRIDFDYFSLHNRDGIKTVDLYVDSMSASEVRDVQYLDKSKVIDEQGRARWRHDDGSLPDIGNYCIPLSHQPVNMLSGHINMGSSIVLSEGRDFRLIRDVSGVSGSIRACDSIELFAYDPDDPSEERSYDDLTPLNIPYIQNSSIEAVQSVIDEQRVVTMDCLVHEASHRYFVIYLTLMYSVFPKDSVKSSVKDALSSWASMLPFGQTIQFSDIETVAANIPGVDNVRVSTESDSGGKESDYMGDGGDAFGAFGIIELERDGKTAKRQFVGDFRMAQNEVFNLADVVVYSRSQQGWGA